MTTAAQTVGVAVLTHNNENTMFYGNKALQQAVEAATDGDVISLSPGTFEGYGNFSKSGLTIIGSGMDEGPSQTILTQFDLNANINDEKFVKLTLKNIYVPGHFRAENGNYELRLEKCQFSMGMLCNVSKDQTSTIEIINCFTGAYNYSFNLNDHFSNCQVSAYNSVLKPQDMNSDTSIQRFFKNCNLLCSPSGLCSINNCIILTSEYVRLSSETRAINCKALASLDDYFGTQTLTNERLPKEFEAFVEGSFYELKPELTSTWVDENGEQIGIYGGPEPFSALPDAPRFTKFNVPTRTDADGKLPVEIEITMPEK